MKRRMNSFDHQPKILTIRPKIVNYDYQHIVSSTIRFHLYNRRKIGINFFVSIFQTTKPN